MRREREVREMREDKTSYHHLYYSAHADPVEELEKLTKPPPCIKLQSPVRDGSISMISWS